MLVGRAHRDRGKGGVGALHGDHTHRLTEVCVHKEQFSGSKYNASNSQTHSPRIGKQHHVGESRVILSANAVVCDC